MVNSHDDCFKSLDYVRYYFSSHVIHVLVKREETAACVPYPFYSSKNASLVDRLQSEDNLLNVQTISIYCVDLSRMFRRKSVEVCLSLTLRIFWRVRILLSLALDLSDMSLVGMELILLPTGLVTLLVNFDSSPSVSTSFNSSGTCTVRVGVWSCLPLSSWNFSALFCISVGTWVLVESKITFSMNFRVLFISLFSTWRDLTSYIDVSWRFLSSCCSCKRVLSGA